MIVSALASSHLLLPPPLLELLLLSLLLLLLIPQFPGLLLKDGSLPLLGSQMVETANLGALLFPVFLPGNADHNNFKFQPYYFFSLSL